MAAVSVSFSAVLRHAITLVLPAGYSPGSEQASQRTLIMSDYGLESLFDADNAPEPLSVVADELTIGGAATTIDLTSDAPVIGAVDGNGDPAASEDLTGKKLMAVILETPTTNTDPVTVKPGAANGYDLFGASITQGIKLPKGENLQKVCSQTQYDAVAAGDKNITFDGTNGDVIRYILIFE